MIHTYPESALLFVVTKFTEYSENLETLIIDLLTFFFYLFVLSFSHMHGGIRTTAITM